MSKTEATSAEQNYPSRPEESPTNFDHHQGRSSAATYFDPDEWDKDHADRLKSRNDGVYDDDRQKWEGEKDKLVWVNTYSAYLSLPHIVSAEAKALLHDLGDIRRLGYYNHVHGTALAALVQSYKRFWLRRGYRQIDTPCERDDRLHSSKRWCDRDDFRQLWTNIGFTEDELREASKLIGEKTSVSST